MGGFAISLLGSILFIFGQVTTFARQSLIRDPETWTPTRGLAYSSVHGRRHRITRRHGVLDRSQSRRAQDEGAVADFFDPWPKNSTCSSRDSGS